MRTSAVRVAGERRRWKRTNGGAPSGSSCWTELTALRSMGLIVEGIKAGQRVLRKDKIRGQYGVVEPYTRMAVGVTGMRRRSGVNAATPGGFSGQASVRREKCGVTSCKPKRCDLCIKGISQEGPLLDNTSMNLRQ